MSEGDFEVMPRGTMEEIRFMRKFANEVIAATEVDSGNDALVLENLLQKIAVMREFYRQHVEKYPVTV